MDILGLIDVPGWLLVILGPILLFLMYTKYKQTYFLRHGLNQKPTTFLLGDFVSAIKQGNEFFTVENLEKYGKVFGMYFGNAPALIINDADILQHIFVKEFSNFTNRTSNMRVSKEWQGSIFLAQDAHWKFIRSAISPAFTSGKMRQMDPYIHRCLDGLHEILEEKRLEGEDFDVDPMIHSFTMDLICSIGFGQDVNSQKDPDNPFVKHGEAFTKFSPASPALLFAFFLPDLKVLQQLFPRSNLTPKESYDFYKAATSMAFEERKKSDSKHRDLLQSLINSHKETGSSEVAGYSLEDYKNRGLTDEEVLANSIVLMLAGYQTTAATLLWLLYDLVQFAECQDKLRDEILNEIGQDKPSYDSVIKLSYLDMVVKETLRFHPASTRLVREAREDTTIRGVPIPKRVMLMAVPPVLHMMEEYWENPRAYKPERFSPENKDKINEFAYCPFGNGPRNCVGMRLALLEVKMTLVTILQKYKVLPSDKLEVPMPSAKHGVNKPGKPLFVKLEKL